VDNYVVDDNYPWVVKSMGNRESLPDRARDGSGGGDEDCRGREPGQPLKLEFQINSNEGIFKCGGPVPNLHEGCKVK